MRLATLAILLTVILSGDAFGQVFRRRPAQGQQPVQPAAETPPQQSAPEPVAEAPKAEAPKVPVDKPKDGRLEPSPTPVIRRTNKRVVAPGLGD